MYQPVTFNVVACLPQKRWEKEFVTGDIPGLQKVVSIAEKGEASTALNARRIAGKFALVVLAGKVEG